MRPAKEVQKKFWTFGRTISSLSHQSRPLKSYAEWPAQFLLIVLKEGNLMQVLLLTNLDQKTTRDLVIEECRVYYLSSLRTCRTHRQKKSRKSVSTTTQYFSTNTVLDLLIHSLQRCKTPSTGRFTHECPHRPSRGKTVQNDSKRDGSRELGLSSLEVASGQPTH